jgi:hypothetical protein
MSDLVWIEKEFWSAKSALAGRIKRISDGEITTDGRYARTHGGQWHYQYEFALTEEAAIKKAEQRRLKKIASLKKQIAKLEALKFEKES